MGAEVCGRRDCLAAWARVYARRHQDDEHWLADCHRGACGYDTDAHEQTTAGHVSRTGTWLHLRNHSAPRSVAHLAAVRFGWHMPHVVLSSLNWHDVLTGGAFLAQPQLPLTLAFFALECDAGVRAGVRAGDGACGNASPKLPTPIGQADASASDAREVPHVKFQLHHAMIRRNPPTAASLARGLPSTGDVQAQRGLPVLRKPARPIA